MSIDLQLWTNSKNARCVSCPSLNYGTTRSSAYVLYGAFAKFHADKHKMCVCAFEQKKIREGVLMKEQQKHRIAISESLHVLPVSFAIRNTQ